MKQLVWRDGNTAKLPLARALLRYLWLIPLVPAFTFLCLTRLDRVNFSDSPSLRDYALGEWGWVLLVSTTCGALAWLFTFYVQTRPVLKRVDTELSFNEKGFSWNKFDLSRVRRIKVSGLGLMGTILDLSLIHI